jgi:DNA-binding transcriptional LysR family regulator
LSDAGRRLLPVALDVTARLDGVLRDISDNSISGKLRIGIPDDHGRAKLAGILASFARDHPKVELDVTCALSTGFPAALDKGLLDLAIYEVEHPAPHEEGVYEDPTCWVAAGHRSFATDESLPVALFDHACWWRDAAIASLEARGAPYRVVYSSQSVAGVIAAVEAGIAVGLLARSSLHSGVSVVGARHGFGATPISRLVMVGREGLDAAALRAASDAMKAAIRAAFLGTP